MHTADPARCVRSIAVPLVFLFALVACGGDEDTASGSPGIQATAAPAAAASTGPDGSGATGEPGASGVAGSPGTTGAPTLGGGDPSGDPAVGGTGEGSAGTSAEVLQDAFVNVVERVGPSVVLIETPDGLGSGVVFDDQGHIVTNAHVVGEATEFRVTTAAGERAQAALVATFPPNDLAVIRVEGVELQAATFGRSADLEVGDIVMAIGNPLGLQSSVTEGIVSALGRTVTEPSGAALPDSIQTSAAINPGNSGGALVDLQGQVVGIPTLGLADPNGGGSAAGIGFAIPSDTATNLAQQMIDNGAVVSSGRAYIGIRGAQLQQAPGVFVHSLDPGGPAEAAGIPEGVVITAIAGEPTPTLAALASVLATRQPGEQVPVDFQAEDGSTSTVEVTLGELPG